MKYICKLCNYESNNKSNYNRHLKTKKHKSNCENKCEEISENMCECGKLYKTRTGLWKHRKKCSYNMQLKIIELEKKNILMEEKTNQIIKIMEKSTNGMNMIANNNSKIISEVKKLKDKKNQIITNNFTNNTQNNIQNVSINVFLNEHCQNAMCLTDFVNNLQITFEDLKHTGKTNYVEGISKILIKNLNKMNKLERPIHCSDVKRKVLYIKNKQGWEKDGEHEKITKCIKDVEFKQIKKIPQWTKEENIDIYKNDDEGMKYQKVVYNSMGGMDSEKREKNKNNVIKNLSKITDFKL